MSEELPHKVLGKQAASIFREASTDKQYRHRSKYGNTHAYGISKSYTLRDDKDEAFNWLNRACENREPLIIVMRSDRMLCSLRGDPRFTAFLDKMHLL